MNVKITAAILAISVLFIVVDRACACNLPPVAYLIADMDFGVTNGSITVTFDASSSFDPDGTGGLDGIYKFEWDFDGDQTYDYSETMSSCPDGRFDGMHEHEYSQIDSYNVTVRVYDILNQYATYTITLTITDTIQAAINGSVDGSIITVAEGTYTGLYNRDIQFYGKAVELRSTDPDDPDVVAATIIDCQGGGRNTYRGFYFCNTGEGSDSIVRGFTIKNGYANGGAIYCVGTSPTIENCVMADNRAGYGGGICISGGQPTIKDCLFSRNTATAGGGIYIVSSSPVVANCVFHDNEAPSGGGMTISGSPTLTNCVFIANEAEYGGAVRINSGASPKITNCTFNSNYATLEGGALYNQSISQSFYVTNCILWGDYAPNGPEIANAGTYSPVVSYCNIQGGGYTGTNINANPQFVVDDDPIGPDGIFGTWDDGLVLGCTSPCRDAGTNTPNGGLLDEDITHRPRIVDGDHDNENGTSATVDMGAYELPRIWFVDKDAQGSSETGYSWAHAYTDLQDALDPDKAYPDDLQSGDEIWVAAVEDQANRNFYTPDISEPYDDRTASFQLYSGVAVYGGFDGAEIGLRLRSWTVNVTVLSGDIDKNGVLDASNSYHVVAGAGNAVLDGFTITGGFANSAASGYCGGGIYCSSVSPLIRNCTIKGNYAAYYGGGMYNTSSNPTLINCVFSGNTTSGGGGMYNTSSCPILINCVFSGNTASYYGGGVYNASSGPTLVSCVFSENTAYTSGRGSSCGGGIYNTSSSPTLANCTFSNNTAKSYGGGIYNTSSSPTLANCTFSKNTVNSYGGAMYNSSSSPILLSCIFRGNTSQNGGGGMCNYSVSSPRLTNCLLVGNVATGSGGGMYSYPGCAPALIDCTFSSNAAGGLYGGGMYNNSNSTTVTNSIFWGNTASSSNVQLRQIYGGTPAVTYSCIQDGSPGASPYPFGGSQNHNLDTDPEFGRNPYNGGNGWGDENDDYGDLRLKRGSPCIDTGDSTAVPTDLLTDLGGHPRIVNTAVDMGAYEYQDVPPVANDDWAQTNVGEAISIYVLANDYEPDPDPLEIEIVAGSGPSHGSVEIIESPEGDYVRYDPDLTYIGRDSFKYRVSDDAQNVSNDATVTVMIYPPAEVSAGSYGNVLVSVPLNLKGRIVNDVLGTVARTEWKVEVVSPPGSTVTSNPEFPAESVLDPEVVFDKIGPYYLTLTAYDEADELLDSDTALINAIDPSYNETPRVGTGLYGPFTLASDEGVREHLDKAYVYDDDLPVWQEWTIIEGDPDGVYFEDTGKTNSPLVQPHVVFTKAGTYRLKLSAYENAQDVGSSDPDAWASTVIVVTGNQTPRIIDAGGDRNVTPWGTAPVPVDLVVTVTDDGLPDPPVQLTCVWSVVGGPDDVDFDQAGPQSTDPGENMEFTTPATFATIGTYTLRVDVSDGELSDHEMVMVTLDMPDAYPELVVVEAGEDQVITLPFYAELDDALVTLDGSPLPPDDSRVGWCKVLGPGEATFNYEAPFSRINPKATFSQAGDYTLELRYRDGIVAAKDQVRITVKAPYYSGTRVSGGEQHTLIRAADADKTVWACGQDGDVVLESAPTGGDFIFWGILGTGSAEIGVEETTFVQVLRGEQLGTGAFLKDIDAVAAGWTHSLALSEDNTVLAWGNNVLGQLGNGGLGADNISSPVRVLTGDQGAQSGFLENIIAIAAGRSGAHSLAVAVDGSVWSWGWNRDGQLGNGKSETSGHYAPSEEWELVPVQVHAGAQDESYNKDDPDPIKLKNIVTLSGGALHSVALEKLDETDDNCSGSVYAWGDNVFRGLNIPPGSPPGLHRLGNPNVFGQQAVPVQVDAGEQDDDYDPITNPVKLQNIVAVSAGWHHTLALENLDDTDGGCNGRVYAWGYNGPAYSGSMDNDRSGGRLGDPDTQGDPSWFCDSPVAVHAGEQNRSNPDGKLENIVAIAAGESHSMALDRDGHVWTWGDNSYGQLGTGKDDSDLANSWDPVKVVAYDLNADGIPDDLNADGNPWNDYLGDDVPIIAISAGYWHCLAMDEKGVVYSWGLNRKAEGNGGNGQLGIGPKGDKNLPQRMLAPGQRVYNENQGKWYSKIQDAIDDVVANIGIEPDPDLDPWNRNTIVVYPGMYVENVDFEAVGGYDLTVRSSDPDDWGVVERTIIHGSGEGDVATFKENFGSIRFEGFTLTNVGYANVLAGGIYCEYSSPTIANCLIQDNRTSYQEGGGICWYNSSGTISSCVIGRNSATRHGGGIYCSNWSSTPMTMTIANCIISDNAVVGDDTYSSGQGGGLHSNNYGSANLSIKNSIFIGNSTNYQGGGLYHQGDDLELTNCTFSQNSAISGFGWAEGGGMYYAGGAGSNITNSIFWENYAEGEGTSQIKNNAGTSSLSFRNCDIQDCKDSAGEWDSTLGVDVDGSNVDVDPLLEYGCYLTSNSQCIDAGVGDLGDFADQTDIDGEVRYMGSGVDIGADEYPPVSIDAGKDQTIFLPQPAILSDATMEYNGRIDPATATPLWSKIEGPEGYEIYDTSPYSPLNPRIDFAERGIYVFQLTAGGSGMPTDTVTISVGLSVEAGGPYEVYWPANKVFRLMQGEGLGIYNPDVPGFGAPPEGVVVKWTQLSGPNLDAEAPFDKAVWNPVLTFPWEGEYSLAVEVREAGDYGRLLGSDTVDIKVELQQSSVSTGEYPDQFIPVGELNPDDYAVLTLDRADVFSGFPEVMRYEWSIFSGTVGGMEFDCDSCLTSAYKHPTVRFKKRGYYTLQLVAFDEDDNPIAADDVTIQVHFKDAPPEVFAGYDGRLVFSNWSGPAQESVELVHAWARDIEDDWSAGAGFDDDMPPAGVTVEWTCDPPTGMYFNTNAPYSQLNPAAVFTSTEEEDYYLTLTVTDDDGPSSDTLRFEVRSVYDVQSDEVRAIARPQGNQIQPKNPEDGEPTIVLLDKPIVELPSPDVVIRWKFDEQVPDGVSFLNSLGEPGLTETSEYQPRVCIEDQPGVGSFRLRLSAMHGEDEVAFGTMYVIITEDNDIAGGTGGDDDSADLVPPEVSLSATIDGAAIENDQDNLYGLIEVTVAASDVGYGIGSGDGSPGVELKLCRDGQPFDSPSAEVLRPIVLSYPFSRGLTFNHALYTFDRPAGTYILAVRARDVAGNYSQIQRLRFTTRVPEETEPPVAKIIYPPVDDETDEVVQEPKTVISGRFIDFQGEAYHEKEGVDVEYKIELFKAEIVKGNFAPSSWQDIKQYFVKNVTPDTDGFCGGPLYADPPLRLDLTGVENGNYQILLTVRTVPDGAYQYANAPFVLECPLKIGNVRFSQEDLVIPVGGIPLRVVRTYDSLNKNSDGDFGFGWSYKIANMDIELDEIRTPMWQVDWSSQDMQHMIRNSASYDRNVTLTLPNGKRTTFMFYLEEVHSESTYLFSARDYVARYASAHGVTAKLETWDGESYYSPDAIGNDRLIAKSFWENRPGDLGAPAADWAYDFAGYVLTAADGTKYFIKRDKIADSPDGYWIYDAGPEVGPIGARPCGEPYLSRIITTNGEEIRVNVYYAQDGVVKFDSIDHWARNGEGTLAKTKSIQFEYEGNHIVRIWAPGEEGESIPTLKYDYDNEGNLDKVHRLVDKEAGLLDQYETTTYVYEHQDEDPETMDVGPEDHYVVGIIDSRGLKPIRYVYDDKGRLVKVIDAKDNEISLEHRIDVDQNVEAVTDRNGNTTLYEYNDRGNVISLTDARGYTTYYTYNEESPYSPDLPVTVTVPVEATDPENVTKWATTTNVYEFYTGDDFDGKHEGEIKIHSVVDPVGNVTQTHYDINANVTKVIQGKNAQIDPLTFDAISETTNNYYYDNGEDFVEEVPGRLTNLIASIETIDPVTLDVLDRTKYEYNYNDGHLKKVRKVDAIGELPPSETTYGYDKDQSNSPDQPYSITNPAGSTRYFYYDENGNQIRSWYQWDDPSNGVGVDHTVYTHTLYDDAGRVIQTSRQLDNAEYDADKATILSRTWYGKLGKPETTVDQFGVLTEYYYDELGNLVETATFEKSGDDGQYAPLSVSRTLYDADGRVLVTTDPHKPGQPANGTENVYDALSRLMETRRWKDVVLDLVPFIVVDGETVELGDPGWPEEPEPAPVPVGMKVRKGVVVANAWDGSTPEPTNIGWTSDGGPPAVLGSLGDGHVAPLSYTRTLHDVAGRVKHSVALDENAYERPTTYEYDDAGKQTAVIDPSGHYIDNPYNNCYADGIVLHNGTTATCINFDAFVYSAYDEQTNPTGNLTGTHKTVTTYEGTRRDSVRDARGNTTKFKYDALGRLIRTEHPPTVVVEGGVDPVATYTHIHYDSLGRKDWESQATVKSGDGAENQVAEKDKRYFEYDSASRLVKVILPEPADGAGYPEYKYIYDDYGNLAGILDPMNRLTVFKYDELNQQTAKYMPFAFTDPTPEEPEPIITISDIYHASHNLSARLCERREYDTLSRLTQVTDFEGRVTAYSYNDRGLLQYKRYYRSESQYSPEYPQANARPQIEYMYDSMGRRDTVKVKEFNAFGEQLSSELYSYDYDTEGRLRVAGSPQGFVRYDYSDITGRKQTVRGFGPDADPVDVYSVEEPAIEDTDTQIGYIYDQLGRLEEVAVDKRNDYAPIPGSEEFALYTYNPVGSQQTLTYPNGNVAEYTYDALNRLTTLTNWKDSGKVENDRRSRFAYELAADGMHKQATEFFTGEGTDTRTVTYDYDNLNRILEETALASDGTYSTQYTYDLVGNRTQRIVTVTNSTVGGTQTLTTTYTYDPDTDWLLSEVHSGPKWAAMFDGRPVYAYADGNGGVVYRDGQTRIGQFKAFLLGLPTKWSQHALAAVLLLVLTAFCLPVLFVIVARLRRASVRLERAGLSLFYRCVSVMLAYVMLVSPICLQQAAEGATDYSSLYSMHWAEGDRTIEYGYDANGSLTQKLTKETSSDTVLETVTYEYNLQNRLVKVTTTADGSTTVSEYKYDPDGNRVQKTVDSTVTDYLIDAYNHTGYAQVFKETTGSDSTVYIIGDDVIGQAKGADENAPKYLLYDGHGSTRQLVNNTGATVLKDYSYDAYGVMLGGNPGSVSNPDAPATNLLYAGEQFDIDAQQYYLRARYYDPLNGRFNRMDDFAGNTEDPQSLHKYLYCHANPVNAIDPSGEMTLVDLSTTTAITALISGIVFTATSIALDAAYGVSGMQMLRNALFAFGATVLAVMSAPFAIALISAVAISLGVKALSEGLSREDGVRVGTFLLVAILLSVIFKNCAFTSRLSPKGNPDVAGTFKNAVYREVTLKPGTLLKRAFERGKTNPIRSYTTRGKTANMIRTQQDAVDLLNLYPAQTKPTDIATLKVSRPVKAWVGKVEGGGSHAFQYWIEDDAALDLVGTEPLPIE